MLFEKASVYFLPPELKSNPPHPEYEERVAAISTVYTVFLFTSVVTVILYLNGYHYPYYFCYGLLNLAVLPLYKRNLQMWGYLAANCLTYPMLYYFMAHTGGIYSVNISILYPFLVVATGILKPKIVPVHIIISILILYLLYLFTPELQGLGSKLYAFISHSLLILVTGFAMLFFVNQKDRLMAESKGLQNRKITVLNDEVSRRTKELNNMRQTLASDFHDETGNMLSAITRQAALLKIKLKEEEELLENVENIISNSNQLYTTSRQFIWNLNNDSDNPQVLFNYLTSFGQLFYNPFDISFSAENHLHNHSLRLEPFAAINLIFIFKEAMNNVVKHAEAKEVVLKMVNEDRHLLFSLTDDGIWKESSTTENHHGIINIEKRCEQNGFRFAINHIPGIGTRVEIDAPAAAGSHSLETATL